MSQMQIGPVEARLSASDQEKLRNLCQLDNRQLLALMDQIIERADPDGNAFDEELFTAAQQLLNERAPIDHHIDTEEMLEQFFAQYASILDEPIPDNRTVLPQPQPRRRRKRFFGGLWIAAALLIIGSAYGLATGRNPITESINIGEQLVQSIRYGQSGQLELPAKETGYHSLQEAYDEAGITAMTLQWIPADLNLKHISIAQDNGVFLAVDAYFEGEDKAMLFHVAPVDDDWYFYDEKEDLPPDIVESHGQTFKFYDNNGWLGIRWSTHSMAYLLTGNITLDEGKQIISALKLEE